MTTRRCQPHAIAVLLLSLVSWAAHAEAQDASVTTSTTDGSFVGIEADRSAPIPTTAPSTRLPDGTSALSVPRRPDIWQDLFSDTWRDVRRLPSQQTVGWLAIGGVAALSVRPADSHVGRSLSTATQLHEPLEPGAFIGSTPLQLGLSAATYALGRSSGSPRMTRVGADLFRAQLVAQGLTMAVKESVRRQRPEGSGFAFPSGHTTVSFASATVLQQHFGWRVGAPAYALASYVAMSRVQMQRHYLSDVAFGAALGIAAGRTITFGHAKQMQLAPMVADGGAGVQVVWQGKQAR